MKLSAWAKKHGYSYTGAWLKFKRGGLPGAYQLEDGTIARYADTISFLAKEK